MSALAQILRNEFVRVPFEGKIEHDKIMAATEAAWERVAKLVVELKEQMTLAELERMLKP